MSAEAADRQRRSFAVRVSLMFAAVAAIIGTNLPFLPVWLDWTGLGPREIAIVTAAPLFVRVLATPLIAFAADRAGDHRRFLVGLAWAGLCALLLLSQARGFWPMLAAMIVFAIAWTTIMPLTETVAMSGVRAAGLDYGRMRLWGSVSFIAASLVGGWVIETAGAGSAIWLIVAAGALTVAAAHGLERRAAPGRAGDAHAAPRIDLAGALGLLRSRTFLVFLLAGGAGSAAHAVFYTFGTLHWQAQGLSAEWAGRLWAISIVAEVALFACSRAVVERVGAVGLLALGSGAGVVRWLAMGLDPPLALLVPLQLLHALTFGAAHLGAVHFISRAVPEGQAGTGQALYASVTGGLGMGTAILAAGPLYANFGGRAYWAMAALAAVGLAASLVLMRMWSRAGRAQ
jgi:MFS transporter, PPP family, 3-phenylpropionic acid transporter